MSANAEALRLSLKTGSRRAFRRGAEIMYQASLTRVPENTGLLASSGKLLTPAETSDEFRQTLIYDAKGPAKYGSVPYASFTDSGTQPHQILPREAGGILVWVGPDGKKRGARSVQHPGTKGTGWFSGIVTENAWETAMQVAFDQTTFD